MKQFEQARLGTATARPGVTHREGLSRCAEGPQPPGACALPALELMRPWVHSFSFPETILINLHDDYGKN